MRDRGEGGSNERSAKSRMTITMGVLDVRLLVEVDCGSRGTSLDNLVMVQGVRVAASNFGPTCSAISESGGEIASDT